MIGGDPYSESFDSIRHKVRLQFGLDAARGRQVKVGPEYARRAERHLARAQDGDVRELWRAVRCSFLSAWHDARGTTRWQADPRSMAVLTGITS